MQAFVRSASANIVHSNKGKFVILETAEIYTVCAAYVYIILIGIQDSSLAISFTFYLFIDSLKNVHV